MTSRGLPGFLRRTLRVDYSFEEDEDGNNTDDGLPLEEEEGYTERKEGPSENSPKETGDSVDQQLTTQASNHASDEVSRTSQNASSETKGGADGAENGQNISTQAAAPIAADASTEDDGPPQRTSSVASESSITVSSKYAATSSENSPPIIETPQPPQEAPRSYRDVQFDKVMSAEVINMAELRKLAWNGIPGKHRAQAWKILLGYLPTNQSRRATNLQRKRAEYKDACAQHYEIDDDTRTAQEQETLRQVLVDVPRTAPEVALFRNERIRRILARLLYVWAMRHPASSYVQGINDLATPLLVVFLADYYQGEDVLDGHVMNHLSEERLDELEADVYWCLTNLLSGIQDHYTADQPGLQRMVLRLEELVHRIDTDLTQHLEEMGVQFLQFSFRWMNCLLLREFDLKCVVRLWDTYISERDGFEGFHVYVCAAFLCQFSPQLQAMSFDELLGFMQKIPTQDWNDTEIEMLLSQAFVLSTLFGGSDAHLTSGGSR